ncbi:hypothetical protein ACFQO4_03690 [Saliphagus sp. GCM10025334]
MFTETDSSPMIPRRDTLLLALANRHSRFVIEYFKDAPEDHATVDDIATAFARRDHADETQVAIRLHHAALPKLDDAGLVDYDRRTKTVRYHGHSQLEQVAERFSESGSPKCHGGVSST